MRRLWGWGGGGSAGLLRLRMDGEGELPIFRDGVDDDDVPEPSPRSVTATCVHAGASGRLPSPVPAAVSIGSAFAPVRVGEQEERVDDVGWAPHIGDRLVATAFGSRARTGPA